MGKHKDGAWIIKRGCRATIGILGVVVIVRNHIKGPPIGADRQIPVAIGGFEIRNGITLHTLAIFTQRQPIDRAGFEGGNQ